MDTIYALATAPGRAGVAVVRVSGPDSWTACERLAGSVPPVRRAVVRKLRDGAELIDEALVLVFEAGQSFTGERVVEFQTHGSIAVTNRLLVALSRLPGFRGADPGEFTRRALENERLDLSQVEGLADLIESETELQRRQALRTLEGDMSRQVEIWRSKLLRAVALLEAGIDFADEDVPADSVPEVQDLLHSLIRAFRAEIVGVRAAERVRIGFEVAIVGAPNAGKSTLLNRMAGREAAITSEIAGTTRDVIEVRMDVDGIPVTFLDTAGLRETEDVIEAIGVERAQARAGTADLRIFLGDTDPLVCFHKDDILVAPKSDLGTRGTGLAVSGKTGAGVDELLNQVARVLGTRIGETGTATSLRQAEVLGQALVLLESAMEAVVGSDVSVELVAEDIRTAIRSVDMLVGRIGVEDVLGEIFSSFCIGK